jgi:hypothetical protein
MPSLDVEVRDDEIIVTQSGSKFRAVYHSVHHKPEDQPQLIVKGTPHGNYNFLAQAWQAANDKARELGWKLGDRRARERLREALGKDSAGPTVVSFASW